MEYPFSVVAVDVGGTKIACAVVRYENADAAPIILSKRSIPTDAQQGGEVVLARILDLIDGVRAEALSHGEIIVGVGVATAGRVDVNTGNIAFANEIMPGWSGQPLGDTGKNGNAAMNHGNGLLQHMVALCVGKEGNLARGAQEEQAINTCVNHAVDRALESLKIKRTLGGQRNDHGRNNAMEFAFSHEKTLFCWIQQTIKL